VIFHDYLKAESTLMLGTDATSIRAVTQLHVSKDGTDRVVEVMRNAAG